MAARLIYNELASETLFNVEQQKRGRVCCDVAPMHTLLLADDSPLIRRMIKRLLQEEPTIVVLGEVSTFDEAIKKASELKPDIILLDLHMPDLLSAHAEDSQNRGGDHSLSPEYIKINLQPLGSKVKIIGMSLSGSEDDEMRKLGASLGACAVLAKARLDEQLIPAILSC